MEYAIYRYRFIKDSWAVAVKVRYAFMYPVEPFRCLLVARFKSDVLNSRLVSDAAAGGHC